MADNYKLKSFHAPILLAKREEKNLKIFEKFGVRSPRVKFRDGALVGMDAILNSEGDIALPLAYYPSNLSKNTIRYK